MTRCAPAVLACLAALLLAPAAASADNLLTITNGEAKIRSDEAGLRNAFQIEERGGEIRFYEPNDLKGINGPPECRPGETKGGVALEVFCPRASVSKSITVLADDAEDTVRYAVGGIPSGIDGDTGADRLVSEGASDDILDGGQGNDVLEAGPGNDDLAGVAGNDDLKGGDGNDKLVGGDGLDAYDGGNGDDTFDTADGVAEKVLCGPGTDTVLADQLDDLVECENAQVRIVAPATGQPSGNDTTGPSLQAAAVTRQRVSRKRRSVRMVATSSEKGLVQVSGFVAAGGINLKLKSARAEVTVGGGGVELRLKLSKRMLRLVRRDLARGRKPRVRLTVSAVDAAGNTSAPRHLTIRLRR